MGQTKLGKDCQECITTGRNMTAENNRTSNVRNYMYCVEVKQNSFAQPLPRLQGTNILPVYA